MANNRKSRGATDARQISIDQARKRAKQNFKKSERQSNTTKPRKKLLWKDKIHLDKEWFKNNLDYFASISRFSNYRQYDIVRELYEMYNNKIYESSFKYVTNPLNSRERQYRNFPAQVRPYNMLRTVIDLLLGEFKDRSNSYTVKVNNPDAPEMMRDKEYEMILESLEQLAINTANELAQNEGAVPPQSGDFGTEAPVKSQEEIQNFMEHSYKDARAEEGQLILDEIFDAEEIFYKNNDMFFDFLIAGEAYSFKEVLNEDVQYKAINPILIDYDRNTEIKFVEDCEWVCRVEYMSMYEIMLRFNGDLSDEDIDDLEDNIRTAGVGAYPSSNYRYRDNDEVYSQNYQNVEVIHATWKAFKKVGYLHYVDEFGQNQEVEVSEEYKLDKEQGDLEIEWEWRPEAYEAWRINGDKYVGMRPIPYQRRKMNQPGYCKLPYNGRRYSNRNTPNISVMRLGVPYQIMFMIVMYRIELMLARDKGKLLMIDKATVPRGGGWNEEKFMYYAESAGYMFVDRASDKKVDRSFNQTTALDMSTTSHVMNLIHVAEFYKRGYHELLGINPQRLGNINSSERVANAQLAQTASSTISEEVFANFDELIRSDLEGLLDLSKFAFLTGKKALHISNDRRNKILEVDPDRHISSDYGIHVSYNTKDIKDLERYKETVLQPLAQNGADALELAEINFARSSSEIRNKVLDFRRKSEQRAQSAQDAESQEAQAEKEFQESLKEIEFNYDRILKQMEIDGRIEIALIQAQGGDGDVTGTGEFDSEREKMAMQSRMESDKNLRETTSTMLDHKIKAAEISKDLQVEKLRAATALKNPVAGEKK